MRHLVFRALPANARRIVYWVILICFNATIVGKAQISFGGSPKSFTTTLVGEIHKTSVPALDPDWMPQEERTPEFNGPLQFAYPYRVQLNLDNAGTCNALPNGDRVWRLEIQAPNAVSINLLYDQFYLPPGALYYLYNPEKTQVLGAFGHHNNQPNHRFATSLIKGDRVILEYYEPARVVGQGIISINQVSYGFKDIDELDPVRNGSCQVGVNCSPEGDNWQEVKKSVTRIIMDGVYVCTGTLMNNSTGDLTPYVLTSEHCINYGAYDAVTNPEAPGFVFYWNYERATCEEADPMPEQTTVGATLVANSGEHGVMGTDFALFRLQQNPSDFYDVHFAGFDASDQATEGGVGIHHPSGSSKKIATYTMVPESIIGGKYWRIYWEETPNGYSVTEGGSSGSALFNEAGQVIGQLFGGSSLDCSDPASDWGAYGKLAYSWNNDGSGDSHRRLKDWLAPNVAESIESIPGHSVGFSIADCEQLFISEYTEGSGLNRCIEVFNPNDFDIDLEAGAFQVRFYFEGDTIPGSIIGLSGIIPAEGVHVLCDDGADSLLLHKADQTSFLPFFNGDDAIELLKGSNRLDILGVIGEDPGQEWGSGLLSTKNNTLKRKIDILTGDRQYGDVFDPALEWEGFHQDYIDNLGISECHCIQESCQLTELSATYECNTDTAFIAVDLENGDLSGPMVNGNLFLPSQEGIGAYELQYISNGDTCTFTVRVEDNTPPQLVGRESDVAVIDGEYVIQLEDVVDLDQSFDLCGEIHLLEIAPNVVTCQQVGQTVEVSVWMADDAGNEAMVSGLIHVISENPEVTGWEHYDLGEASLAGVMLATSCDAQAGIEVLSNSLSGGLTEDNGHFVYQEICGDMSIVAEVTDVGSNGSGGLMIREDSDPGARRLSFYVRSSPFVSHEYRFNPGEEYIKKTIFRPGIKWLKLERIGALIRGYASYNGETWYYMFQKTVGMQDCVQVGLFSKTNVENGQCSTVFNNISIETQSSGLLFDPTAMGTVENAESLKQAFHIYPNPTQGSVNVEFKHLPQDDPINRLLLLDISGKVVRSWENPKQKVMTFTMIDLTPGVYWLQVQTLEGVQTKRVIRTGH